MNNSGSLPTGQTIEAWDVGVSREIIGPERKAILAATPAANQDCCWNA
jgi:hypothetical protein